MLKVLPISRNLWANGAPLFDITLPIYLTSGRSNAKLIYNSVLLEHGLSMHPTSDHGDDGDDDGADDPCSSTQSRGTRLLPVRRTSSGLIRTGVQVVLSPLMNKSKSYDLPAVRDYGTGTGSISSAAGLNFFGTVLNQGSSAGSSGSICLGKRRKREKGEPYVPRITRSMYTHSSSGNSMFDVLRAPCGTLFFFSFISVTFESSLEPELVGL